MPIPVNIDIDHATELGATLPITITQDAFFGGNAYDLWFKRTALPGEVAWGAFGFGTGTGGGTYRPTTSVWTDPLSPVNYLGISALMVPLQMPVVVGTTYYFRCRDTFNTDANPSTLTFTLRLAPDDPLNAGQIAVNDSTEGFPLVIMNGSTAEPVAFRTPFAAGEGTAVLRSGEVAALTTDGDGVVIYNADLTERVTPVMPAAGFSDCLACNHLDTFWVGKNGGGATHAEMVSFDRDGVFGTPIDLGSAGLKSLAPSQDGSVILFTKNTANANQAVFQVTNPGGVVTTFKAGVANYNFASNLFMLFDDTVLVSYERTGFATVIHRYNLAGVEQTGSPYTLAVDPDLDHIFGALNDPTSFWIRTLTSTNQTFTNIITATGADTDVGPISTFIDGASREAPSATPSTFFGPDLTCVPWVLRAIAPTETFPIRRQRRFMLPSSPDNKIMQIPVIELLMRTGIGLTEGPPDAPVQGSDPQVMIRLSKDGGKTWGNERWISAGKIGQYLRRVRLLRATGNYRNAVLEVSVSDPVDWQFLAALAPNGIIEGSS